MNKKIFSIGTIFALSLSVISCDGLGTSEMYSYVDLTDADILTLAEDLEFPELNKIEIKSSEEVEVTAHNVQVDTYDYAEGQGTDVAYTTTTDIGIAGSIEASLYANLTSQEAFYVKGQVALSDIDVSNAIVTDDPDVTEETFDVAGSASLTATARDRGIYLDTVTSLTGDIVSSLNEKESSAPAAEEDGLWDAFELGGTTGVLADLETQFLETIAQLKDAETIQEILDDPVAQLLLDEVEVGIGSGGYQIKLEINPALIDSIEALVEPEEPTVLETQEDTFEFSANTLITITLKLGESVNSLELEYVVGLTSTTYDQDYWSYSTCAETTDWTTTIGVTISGSSSASFVATQPTIPTTFTGYTDLGDNEPAIFEIFTETDLMPS